VDGAFTVRWKLDLRCRSGNRRQQQSRTPSTPSRESIHPFHYTLLEPVERIKDAGPTVHCLLPTGYESRVKRVTTQRVHSRGLEIT
jgi:hypothetical protein